MPLWDFPEGTLCRREVAAYVVARALGWPNVPPTILRDGPEGLGSVQTFITFDPEEHYFTLQERFADEFRAVALFDRRREQRRPKGWALPARRGRPDLVIDHGVCFSAEPKLRTVIWEYMDERIPPSLLAGIERLGTALDEGGPERDELGALLDEEELLALRRRIAAIVGFPRVPWPGRRPSLPLAAGVSELELLVGEVATPLGALTLVASPRGVVATAFDDEDPDMTVAGIEARLDARARSAQRRLAGLRREVEDYFAGRIRTFATPPDLALARQGFGRRVLEVTDDDPLRRTVDLWRRGGDGRESSWRASRRYGLEPVPHGAFVPCHRVVHAGGTLGGYGRFTERKRWLLRHEGAV